MSEKVKNALVWIKSILESEKIPYQIVGGLAVKTYGGSRPVADIDLYVPKSEAHAILPFIEPYISRPLSHYIEEYWDLEYCQLIYQDQKIEIGLSPGTKICSKSEQAWKDLKIDYQCSVNKDFLGVSLPVMPIPDLIEYKTILGREVDLVDVKDLTKELRR